MCCNNNNNDLDVRSLQVGNQTATAIALAALVDYNLREESTQSIVIGTGGTELLINLLETDHQECRVNIFI